MTNNNKAELRQQIEDILVEHFGSKLVRVYPLIDDGEYNGQQVANKIIKLIADRENQLRQEIVEAIKDEPLDWPYEGGISLPRIRNKLRAEIREAIAAIQGEPNGLN